MVKNYNDDRDAFQAVFLGSMIKDAFLAKRGGRKDKGPLHKRQ